MTNPTIPTPDRVSVAIVELGGSSLFLEADRLADIQQYIDFDAPEGHGDNYNLTFKTMTRAEFEALGEFDGF